MTITHLSHRDSHRESRSRHGASHTYPDPTRPDPTHNYSCYVSLQIQDPTAKVHGTRIATTSSLYRARRRSIGIGARS